MAHLSDSVSLWICALTSMHNSFIKRNTLGQDAVQTFVLATTDAMLFV